MRTDFAETRLDLHTKATGGYSFRNTIQQMTNSLQERRICNNPYPLFKGALTRLVLTECELDYFTTFFNARRGKTQGFRYKFWADYKCTAEPLNLVEGFTQGGVLELNPGQTQFQMCKRYVSSGQETLKPLYKIVPGSVTRVLVDGIELVPEQQYGVENNTGILNVAVPVNESVSFDCQFDIPVRFDIDKLPSITELVDTQHNRLCYSFGSIPLVEIPMIPTQVTEVITN